MSDIDIIQWREPLWLSLGLVPLMIYIAINALRYFQHHRYAEKHLLPWAIQTGNRQLLHNRLQLLATILAWCCFAIAMAGPRIAEKVDTSRDEALTEVMILLDLSQSMAAKDILPNRLQRAHLELLDFLQQSDRLRVGLSVFAARPHLMSPLTSDTAVIKHYLASLKPQLLPTAGSNLYEALQFASQSFSADENSTRAILLLSDGDISGSTNENDLLNTIQHLKRLNIRVYSLGIGTQRGQAVVSRLESDTTGVHTTVSKLQRAALEKISTLSNGFYSDVTDDNSDWQKLYTEGIARLAPVENRSLSSDRKILWQELYHLPLVTGVVLFILALIRPASRKTISQLVLLCTVIFSHGTNSLEAAEISYRSAYQYYESGDYDKARQLFAQLPGYESRLGEANAFYQQGDYTNARDIYVQAILLAGTDQQRADALFNLGNTYYQLTQFNLALQMYADTLKYSPAHAAAKTNMSHAERQRRLKEAEEAITYRSGRGPRTGRAAENIDLSNTQVSLGESATTNETILPKNAPGITRSNFFQQAELASQAIDHNQDEQWSFRYDSVAALHGQRHNFMSDHAYVWQRLFEMEEGFAAPLQLPHAVPGVSPW